MRVLQLHTTYRQPGGEDKVAAAEAALLRAHGHEVVQHWRTNPESPWSTVGSLAQAPYNRGAATAVRRIVTAARPDVAHVHNTWFGQSVSVIHALRRLDVPVIATVHNYRFACINGTFFRSGRPCFDCLGRRSASGVVHRCYRNSTALSTMASATVENARRLRTWTHEIDRLIAPSDTVGMALLRAGAPPERVIVKPHFVTDPGPRSTPPSASSDVVFAGRLAPGKGVDVLLEAWRRADTGRMNLLILGDGPLRRPLEAAAPPGVRFLGHLSRESVLRRLLSARALAFPSTWPEPFGLVLIEAMAAGLPVVGTDVGAVRSIVDPVPADLLATSGDPTGLAIALERVVDPHVVDAAGCAARRRYADRFTPEANLPQLLAIYRSAVA